MYGSIRLYKYVLCVFLSLLVPRPEPERKYLRILLHCRSYIYMHTPRSRSQADADPTSRSFSSVFTYTPGERRESARPSAQNDAPRFSRGSPWKRRPRIPPVRPARPGGGGASTPPAAPSTAPAATGTWSPTVQPRHPVGRAARRSVLNLCELGARESFRAAGIMAGKPCQRWWWWWWWRRRWRCRGTRERG